MRLLLGRTVVHVAVLGVAQRPRTLVEVAGIRRGAPGMAVLRNLAVAIEVIEQHELLHDRVLIRRDVAAEQNQAGIAIAFRNIAENLVVRAVLLDDVEHVLDGGAFAGFGGDHGIALEAGLEQQLVAVRRVLNHLFGVFAQLGAVGSIDEGEQSGQVVAVVHEPALNLFADRTRDVIGTGPQALAAADQDPLAIRSAGDRGRIPAGRDEAAHFALTAIRYRNHGYAVVIGVGDIEFPAVRRERQRVRRAADRRLGRWGNVDGLHLGFRLEVDRDNVVRVAARDEQPAVGGDHEIVRVRLGREMLDYLGPRAFGDIDRDHFGRAEHSH